MSWYGAEAKVRKEAFSLVPETCPIVDDALRELIQAIEEDIGAAAAPGIAEARIKQQTTALRDALVAALVEKYEAESSVEDLERQVSALERERDDWKDEYERMKREYDALDEQMAAQII